MMPVAFDAIPPHAVLEGDGPLMAAMTRAARMALIVEPIQYEFLALRLHAEPEFLDTGRALFLLPDYRPSPSAWDSPHGLGRAVRLREFCETAVRRLVPGLDFEPVAGVVVDPLLRTARLTIDGISAHERLALRRAARGVLDHLPRGKAVWPAFAGL